MSEVGIIGQMYEDRRTKKTGKLIERDEKYKTLMLESPDGKTFSVSFSGFKSNWRKMQADDAIAESMSEVELIDEPVVVKPVKQSKPKTVPDLSRSDAAIQFYGNYVEKIANFVSGFETPHVVMASSVTKCSVSVKVNNKRIFETYTKYRKNLYNTIIPGSIVAEYPGLEKLGNMHLYLENSPNKNNVCLHLTPENAELFLEIMHTCVLDKLTQYSNQED